MVENMPQKQEGNKYSDLERRQFTRIPVSFHVYFTPCGFNKNNLVKGGFPDYCYSNNICIEGIQLKFHHKPKIEEFLKIQITLRESQIINVIGKVVWFQYDEIKEIYTAGIQFEDLEDADKKKLENFIKESLKKIL